MCRYVILVLLLLIPSISQASISFNGSQNINSQAFNSGISGGKTLSMSAWINLGSGLPSTYYSKIISKPENTNHDQAFNFDVEDCAYEFGGTAGKLCASMAIENSSLNSYIAFSINNSTVPLSGIHHIVCTWNNTSGTASDFVFYFDDVVQTNKLIQVFGNAYATTLTMIDSSSVGLYLGSACGGTCPSEYFNGQIGDVAVWNTQLTSGDVATLWNAGTPNALARIPLTVKSSNLIIYYPLTDQTSGTVSTTPTNYGSLSINMNNVTGTPSWSTSLNGTGGGGGGGGHTYYVRDGGGTPTQCNGIVNAVYPGSGTNQNCAWARPMTATGYCTGNESGGAPCQYPGVMVAGDTLYIDGDSDINPGQQAQYEVGYDDISSTLGALTQGCNQAYPYACQTAPIPGGLSSSARTSIIGTGSHKPQIWGTQRTTQVFITNASHIAFQNLEITDHQACAYNDPSGGCNYSGPYPWGQWAVDGLNLSGDDLILTDMYIHGLGRYGIVTGQIGSTTMTRTWVIGNGYGGITYGNNGSTSITGTVIFNQPIVEWNGCVEAKPVTGGIDNPSNYTNCFGQNSGGYGDGLAFGASGSQPAGNWVITGPGSVSFNVQDGLDTLHGTGTGSIQIDKMRFEGNGGDQVKMNAATSLLTNSLIVGDCGWWYQAPQSLSGGMQPGDSCRALGDVIVFNVSNNSLTRIYNNTILSNGNITLESDDAGNTGCNGNTAIYVNNNIILGGYTWIDDTSWNSSGGNSQTTYIYNDGNDGNGSGTCGNLTWSENYNVVSGTKNSNGGCVGPQDKCGTSPGFASGTFPMGTSGGGRTTYYTGQSAITNLPISGSSGAVGAGQSGLSYWNNGNDFYNVTRTTPPAIGGLELNSCAANAYFCQYNSSCCGSSCVNNFCGGSCTSNGGACSTGGSCCSTLCQSSVCVSCLSNGISCSTGSNCCSGICTSSVCAGASIQGLFNASLGGNTKQSGICSIT